jgi:hypothetical protein
MANIIIYDHQSSIETYRITEKFIFTVFLASYSSSFVNLFCQFFSTSNSLAETNFISADRYLIVATSHLVADMIHGVSAD